MKFVLQENGFLTCVIMQFHKYTVNPIVCTLLIDSDWLCCEVHMMFKLCRAGTTI